MSDMTFYVRGEWEDEPDSEEFVHAELPCLVVRTDMGHLCGYVGVPKGHPAYPPKTRDANETMRKGLRDFRDESKWAIEPRPDAKERIIDVSYEDLDVDVHGGLTFGDMGDDYMGRRKGFKWLGFDCAHGFDFIPATNADVARINAKFPLSRNMEKYRNWEYVKREVIHLAEQLAAMWQPPDYKEWLKDIQEATTVKDL